MDGDGHVLARADLEVDGIRYDLSARRDFYRCLAVERQAHRRLLIDLTTTACRLGDGQFHGPDLCGFLAELIGEFQAHLLAAYRHLHDLAQGVVRQSWRRGIVMPLYELRGSTPCAYPVAFGQSHACREQADEHKSIISNWQYYNLGLNHINDSN